MNSLSLLLLAGSAAAFPPLLRSRSTFTGIATFNNYGAQGSTVCGAAAGVGGTFGAAASDISPDISGGHCAGSIDTSQCSGQSPGPGFSAPSCPKTNCGKCYRVENQGAAGGGTVSGIGNQITVQIIDSCPSTSAQNFCKTDIPANQRCSDPGTNQLDIDTSAYIVLTGLAFGGGPTLKIGITPVDCAGGSSTDSSGSTGPSSVDTSGGSSKSSPAAVAVQTPHSFVAQQPYTNGTTGANTGTARAGNIGTGNTDTGNTGNTGSTGVTPVTTTSTKAKAKSGKVCKRSKTGQLKKSKSKAK